MRLKEDAPELWRLWEKGGPFVGENASNCYVTVEPNWWLYSSRWPATGAVQNEAGGFAAVPIRSFQREANDQIEWVVPNIKSIQINRSVDADAGTCNISIFNQKMTANTDTNVGSHIPGQLGQPGYYSPNYGVEPWPGDRSATSPAPNLPNQKAARWQQYPSEWAGVLGPNAMIRTYQGYGGRGKSIEDAVADGNVVLTGMWLVDRVATGTDGMITLECRDMAKLLIDQSIYPPLVPAWRYPLEYARWFWEKKTIRVKTGEAARNVKRRAVYRDSSEDRWYPSRVVPGRGAPIHGHYPGDAVDNNPSSYWLSVGNSHPSKSFCTNWIEFSCGEEIDGLFIDPWGGPYTCYISLYIEGQGWIGSNTVPYDHTPLIGTQPHVVDTGADIPYMKRVEVGGGSISAGIYRFSQRYKPKYIRLSFRNHKWTQWGPWHYRVGLQNFYPVLTYKDPQYREETKLVKKQGNYMDYADIVKDLLLWAGFWLYPIGGYVRMDSQPKVFGNIESTGAWNEEPLPRDMFDKKSVMEAINELSGIVAYSFWVDEDGAAHWEAPNWYKAGNFDITSGAHTEFIPEINEKHNLISYGTNTSDQPVRSQIIISTMEPQEYVPGTVTVTYKPQNADMLKGMVKPAMWIQGHFANKQESRVMAELIALRSFFAQRQGTVRCVANPCLGINDQVRIVERNSSDVYIHYIRSIDTTQDVETGEYTSQISTHWLGDTDQWVVIPPTTGFTPQRYYVVQAGDTWDKIIETLKARYGKPLAPGWNEWTVDFLRWVNRELLEDTDNVLLEGMVLKV